MARVKRRLLKFYAMSLKGGYNIEMLFKSRHNIHAEFKRAKEDGDNIVIDDNGSVHQNVNLTFFWSEATETENQEHLHG